MWLPRRRSRRLWPRDSGFERCVVQQRAVVWCLLRYPMRGLPTMVQAWAANSSCYGNQPLPTEL